MTNQKTAREKSITLERFIEKVQPKGGLIVLNEIRNKNDSTGNEFSTWGIVERTLFHQLGKLGVSPLIFYSDISGSPLDFGFSDYKKITYSSPYEEKVKEIDRQIWKDKNTSYSEGASFKESFENWEIRHDKSIKNSEKRLLASQKAKEADENFMKGILEQRTALWIAGCFCCIPAMGRLDYISKNFDSERLGIVFPTDNYTLDNGYHLESYKNLDAISFVTIDTLQN